MKCPDWLADREVSDREDALHIMAHGARPCCPAGVVADHWDRLPANIQQEVYNVSLIVVPEEKGMLIHHVEDVYLHSCGEIVIVLPK